MRSIRSRTFPIFALVFVLLGIGGVYTSGAATVKYTVPSAPSNVHAVGGLNQAILTWNAPSSKGGKTITSYKVVIYPGAKVYLCKSSARRCVVRIDNPNKPSAKPVPVRYTFTVAATNSVGTGHASLRSAYVLVRFRATLNLANKFAPPTPTIKPSPTATAKPIPLRICAATTAFDGVYGGTAVVTMTTPASVTGITSNMATTFTVLNGNGKGVADTWTVEGCVTDLAGVASVTASYPLYGSLTFDVTFTQDPVTKVMSGTGTGTQTFTITGIGEIKVEFVFNVSQGATG